MRSMFKALVRSTRLRRGGAEIPGPVFNDSQPLSNLSLVDGSEAAQILSLTIDDDQLMSYLMRELADSFGAVHL